ncbi:MAG TPA: tryptophan 2,3-dioxygenase family protein [Amycolatopsis sp.]|uniref:tryptophan 2,3-dioxygenase n=1 Tax=Amycolatopsis sp. TaxID=37632 RepID=UPI002B46F52C|nr:tryptophan 2,3-dioxygenase family protein [Amycolatopsis sp.]HKS44523.1 tryptophan 2,3-dioxygenase family protein [Amycolatopsis sp.]
MNEALVLDFDGRVPYDAYVRAGVLHRLQRTRGDDPGEMSFLVVSQIMELYFGLIDFELREAQRRLRAGEVGESLTPLRRAALHLSGLDASWQSLSWMTPADFNRFRELLGEASGMQSAMYRKLEFRLGLKTASLVRPFRRDPETYGALVRALGEPSLWDDTIAVLARHGHDIPRYLLGRDFTEEHDPHPSVEAAWVEIYRDDGPGNHLRLLGEALTEVAERFGEWRYHHLAAVRRAMGAKPGTGGTSGIGWLERSTARVVFPELWSARTHM